MIDKKPSVIVVTSNKMPHKRLLHRDVPNIPKCILTIFTLFFQIYTIQARDKVIVCTFTNRTERTQSTSDIVIELKQETFQIAKTLVNPDGKFVLITNVDRNLDLIYTAINLEETYIRTISPSDPDTIRIVIEIPKKYRKSFGHVVCPKCKRRDMTIPIRYGLGSAVLVRQVGDDGVTTYINYDRKNYYSGQCVTSDFHPKWFCKRDKLKF